MGIAGRAIEEGNDAELVRQAQAGDRDAFGRLVERYMRRAYVGAFGLVGSREDALDLSQEAFVRAFRARRSIDPARPFYAWYYTILQRLCFNFVRDGRARAARLDAASWWIAADAAERVIEPDRALEAEERRRRVASALEQLPAAEREALILKEFEGLKYREIAEVVGVPIGTVMSRLYAARRRLAEALEAAEARLKQEGDV